MSFLNTSTLHELFYTQAEPVCVVSGEKQGGEKITVQSRLGLRPATIPKETGNTRLKESKVSNQENIRGSSVEIPAFHLTWMCSGGEIKQ